MTRSIVLSKLRNAVVAAGALALALAGAPAAGAGAGAQTTTGNIRGTVRDVGGVPVPNATIVATGATQGITRAATTNESGFYNLAGLRPDQYTVTVRRIGFAPQGRVVQVQIGATVDATFQVSAAATELTEVVVTAAPSASTTRTSEVATNVSRQQIEALPQQDRNFLNIAGLAPGITVRSGEENKQLKAGGLNASKINVFIDGASYKNEVLEGGVHGQDASRGNPFPQLAIREFRVITQNFKAEYQRAASAVVTATTRSGTNEFEVDGFILGQNRGLVTLDPGARLVCSRARATNPSAACDPKPEYERLQAGVSVGGPLIRDRLHFFGGYEGNIQNREAQVRVQNPTYQTRFAQYEGSFQQPFRSHLPFGKLTFKPSDTQTLDVSYNGRIESDERNFGGRTSYESAENVKIGYHVLTLQHGWTRGNLFNQAHVSAQRSTWNPTVLGQGTDIGLDYENVIRIGSRSTEQKFVQDRIAFRNDLTYSGFQWLGNHVFKGGGNLDLLNYDVEKRFDGNPTFVFNPAESMDVPIRATYGLGDPGMDAGNTQFGAFIQDDWDVTDRLQLNLGVRWDAETNLFNNDWVTPDSIRQQFPTSPAAQVINGVQQRFLSYNTADYYTGGRSDRPMFLGAFQPRLGFSLDVLGTGSTVVHGGFGVYYDREIWNRLLDERFRLQWRVLTFPFTTTGETNEIAWQPGYLSREGLEGILAQANAPGLGELFLLNNDTKPPRSHQWNLGVRQTIPVLANVVVGAAYRGVRGYNIMSWTCATPHSVHGYCEGLLEQGTPKFRGILISTDEGRSVYDAVDLTLEKPLRADSRWGATFAYTRANGERKGNDFFTTEYPGVNPADWVTEQSSVEKHRISASAIVGLPWEIQASTLAQWGSGTPFNRNDEIAGWGPARVNTCFACEDAPDWSQVDFRLQKSFTLPVQGIGMSRVGLTMEVINVFDKENFREFEQFYRGENATAVNPQFGQPLFWTSDTGRRLQFGLNFGR